MWTKSSKCYAHACVEVSPGSLTVWVRDSTRPDKVLGPTHADWRVFLADVRGGRFR